MLKIRDDIDLKELEKFGFEFIEAKGIYANRYLYLDEDVCQSIEISANDRTICVEDTSESYSFGAIVDKALTVLFDLIQAGLVEKEED